MNTLLDIDWMGWMDEAACARRPGLGWVKDFDQVGLGEECTMAVVCAACPVLTACEAYVEAAGICGGFWAGHHRTPDGPLLPVTGDAA